jgi:type II secretory pathway pseudopilin PulG
VLFLSSAETLTAESQAMISPNPTLVPVGRLDCFASIAPDRRGRCRRGAFSLVEALVALSITALAGAVLLLSVESSLSTTTEAVERTIADGVAQQVLDEMLTEHFAEPGEDPLLGSLGATVWELLGSGTERFNDADDYDGYVAQPLKGVWGEVLGTGNDEGSQRLANFRIRSDYFEHWRERVEVYYVNPDNHTLASASPTAYRAIEVFVERIEADGAVRPLASRKRIITYIPPPQN